MGLGVTLGNALAGMKSSQSSLEVLSRNVANSGTPGYHRQSQTIVDINGVNSSSVLTGKVQRAFNQGLQAHYTRSLGEAGFSSVRAEMLDRLQTFIGKPGAAGGLDSAFNGLRTAVQQLGTSPDDYATRAGVVAQAQGIATTLNGLSRQVQDLRQEAELKLSSSVEVLNQSISSLGRINERLRDLSSDGAGNAALMDQRDRLVEQVSQLIDVRADYHSDGRVTLLTRSGLSIVDAKTSTFEFQSAGALSAQQQFNPDPQQSGVGRLLLHTPSGLTIDLVQQNVLKSGEVAGLLELRDRTLTAAQDQLDEIAAALARAFSTVRTEGTPATSGAAQGLAVDIAGVRDGNDLVLQYTQAGIEKSVRVMRVDDTTKLPLNYLDANGTRVVGVDFSAGASGVATALATALGAGFSVSNPAGSMLRVLDDGAAGATTINGLATRTTPTALQNGALALNLFVDAGNTDFTGSLSGKGQKLGFAGRIGVNSSIVIDNKLLVAYQPGVSLGDPARPNYILDQLSEMRFASGQAGTLPANGFRLGGTVSDLIAQTMDHQGNVVTGALSERVTQQLTMEALRGRLQSEYGVNVDEEMGRLIELQNAYAANARIISAVQELLGRLMDL